MKDDDLLILTADHGNDPCTPGTDHTREYVPLLVYHHNIKLKELPLRQTFADIAKTIDENFELNTITHGTSFYQDIL